MKIKTIINQFGLLFLLFPFFIECYKSLTNESLRHLAKLIEPKRLSVDGELMKPLLVERVSGTTANQQVREYIVQHFQKLGWHVELDEFIDTTPFGNVSFANIIVTQNPKKSTRLVLAAHYDSMHSPDFEFIGATDSAVPCGILMNMAEILQPILSDKSTNYRQSDKTLQFIFFDGEEAFKSWSPTDSIYGARHLANVWESSLVSHPKKVFKNKLDQIEVMVLLDLLGVANTQFPNYYRSTSWLYNQLIKLESRLISLSLFHTKSAKTNEELLSLFNPNSFLTYRGEAIGDDHVPFLIRGVNVLHLITHPFPYVWHTKLDNAECIDSAVVENLATLFCTFVAEYLELNPLPHHEL
ncbi:Glutaminyl-peptide cyclotransferase [Cokeromyces recurvatus]|uniref:Glutaminyl-peptide cyclotransferase n=1 Tax=Cokeromyces recurvatus TaxID=90255 RepID=UPI00221EC21D|nr:Glutaminyl-peptide cyclotransferase [Cokeromyces recurvatus]KAI7906535.1 Glutaminyl-peptide cyclotransferase [Cokeromyces recurvatus]